MLSIYSYFYSPNIHRLLYITASYALGIWWQTTSYSYYFLALPLGILFASAYYFQRHKAYLILVSAFFIGCINFTHQVNQQKKSQQLIEGKVFDAIGTIVNNETNQGARFNICTTLAIKKIKYKENSDNWITLNKNIQIYTRRHPQFQVGDIIEIKSLQGKANNKKSFNDYLIKENIISTLFVDSFEATLIKQPRLSLARWLNNLRKNLLYSIKRKLSKTTYPLFSSIFLGHKSSVKKQMEKSKDRFKVWGISHYLARSGLHLIIFILLWNFLFSFIPLPFRHKQLILLLLSCIYFVLSWTSISFLRAFYTFVLYRACLLLSVPANFLHLLTLVCLTTLIINPMQLFFLDFQLSFGLTFALVLLNHIQPRKGLAPII